MAKIACSVMLAAVVVATMILSSGPYTAQAQGACKADVSALMLQCGQYVGRGGPKTEPSQGCCGVVKETDVQCVCEHLPPAATGAIDMDKVFYVCQSCGNPIKPGSKCGTGGNNVVIPLFRNISRIPVVTLLFVKHCSVEEKILAEPPD